jgi:hypothetical protein
MTDILNLPMKENDAGAATVGDYLVKLLLSIWKQGEGFSGKRPFGNSGWEYDLYHPLVKSGLIWGELDEDDCLVNYDYATADLLITNAIKSLWKGN